MPRRCDKFHAVASELGRAPGVEASSFRIGFRVNLCSMRQQISSEKIASWVAFIGLLFLLFAGGENWFYRFSRVWMLTSEPAIQNQHAVQPQHSGERP
jgi:hypothetical protein